MTFGGRKLELPAASFLCAGMFSNSRVKVPFTTDGGELIASARAHSQGQLEKHAEQAARVDVQEPDQSIRHHASEQVTAKPTSIKGTGCRFGDSVRTTVRMSARCRNRFSAVLVQTHGPGVENNLAFQLDRYSTSALQMR